MDENSVDFILTPAKDGVCIDIFRVSQRTVEPATARSFEMHRFSFLWPFVLRRFTMWALIWTFVLRCATLKKN
jgi:hypothetical protein